MSFANFATKGNNSNPQSTVPNGAFLFLAEELLTKLSENAILDRYFDYEFYN